ncbi:MAG: DNA-directed RNA polymerase [Candidatus Diapherotrites archaeon]|nr:DNA-directed RNA polymerase [Candidatus Diapherotrites archaeon]
MYSIVKIKEKVRVPPKMFSDKLEKSILAIVQEEYEGLIDEDIGLVIAVTKVDSVGEGNIVLGDGAAYYEADVEMLVYKPFVHEIVEGNISEVTEFGAFVRISPIEGLIHVSQIMDDFINYDAKLPGFVGKKTKKKLVVDEVVLARIVSVSLKGNIQNSKIGLTMRQPFLGKQEWAKIDESAVKTGAAPIGPKKQKQERQPRDERGKGRRRE